MKDGGEETTLDQKTRRQIAEVTTGARILEYQRPRSGARRGGVVSGWVSLFFSLGVIPLDAVMSVCEILAIFLGVIFGIHAAVSSRG